MSRQTVVRISILVCIIFGHGIVLSPSSLAKEWEIRKPQGTLRIVELNVPWSSVMLNYAEALVTVDKDNNVIPCLAEDWRWLDDQTIEFRLRRGVFFHNGEEFNAEAVRTNWEEYRRLEIPRPFKFMVLPDDSTFEIIDDYTVRFRFPEPIGLAYVKFGWFFQLAPAFFARHSIPERNWAYLPEAGPWGTGPFKFVEGKLRYGWISENAVLEAYEGYWNPKYPKVKRVIFDNELLDDREEAMRLCSETEGKVDIVTFMRPLDTLKLAGSAFAKVVKSKDDARFLCWFNQRKKGSKWLDIRLRKALTYSVNREELRKYCAKGNAYNLAPIPYDTSKARELLEEAGYPDGFEVKVITTEALKLEAQIIGKMLRRVGLRALVDVLTEAEYFSRILIPILKKPPEEQEWDLSIGEMPEWTGHRGASFLTLGYTEGSDMRWIKFDPIYEKMWREMARTVDRDAQDKKIRQMRQYLRDNVYDLDIYSPVTLYAVNKEVDFVPQKTHHLRLKETSVTDDHWSIRAKNN